MINPERLVRRAIFQALDGNITVTIDGSNSPVQLFEGVEDDSGLHNYVVFGSQTGNDTSTKSSFDTVVRTTLDIVCKQNYQANKEYLDDISDQIETILLPSQGTNGLVAQSGVQFLALKRESANYIDLTINSTQSIVRKLLTFSVRVREL